MVLLARIMITTFSMMAFIPMLILPTEAVEAAEAPLNYFLYSDGPAAKPTMYLGWVLTGLSLVICLIITLLLLAALIRKRPKMDQRAISNEGKGISWIYIGTGISTLILFGLVIYSFMVVNKVAKPSQPTMLAFTVTGYGWWWKIEYEHDDPAQRFVTANELHIPVGQPVRIKLKSADVIHAFWVPKLAGKTQMVPGLINQQWLQADRPGIYSGQCVQFCGVGHAHMGLEVVAESAEDFEKWLMAQQQMATSSAISDEKPGYELFMERCAGCHTIRGTDAQGKHAPDLTHLNSRHRIAAGLLMNTPDQLMEWIMHAQKLKPGSRMPSFTLSEQEASVLASFLSTLD